MCPVPFSVPFCPGCVPFGCEVYVGWMKEEKLCSKCRVVKPRLAFYTAPSGQLSSWCRDCHNAHSALKRQADALEKQANWDLQIAARKTDGKVCWRCKRFCLPGEFGKDATKVDGMDSNCRSCKKDVRNPRQRAKYALDAEYRADCIARVDASRKADPEYKKKVTAWRKTAVDQLSDTYIKKLLVPSGKGELCRAIPDVLIKVKRQHLKLLREIKDQENRNEQC